MTLFCAKRTECPARKTVCLTRQCGTESCAKDGVSYSTVWDSILRENGVSYSTVWDSILRENGVSHSIVWDRILRENGVSYSAVWDRILRERRCILLDSAGQNPARKTVCLTRQCGTESCAKDGVYYSIVWDRILRDFSEVLPSPPRQGCASFFFRPASESVLSELVSFFLVLVADESSAMNGFVWFCMD